MRLSLSVLLVTLALYCYEANATICPAFVLAVNSFLFQGKTAYKTTIQTLFDPPQEVVEAKIAAKACMDQISFKNKMLIASIVEKTMKNCI